MPKVTAAFTEARREEILNACERLYQTTDFKDITVADLIEEIAALGDAQFLVEKTTDGERTQTQVIRLDEEGRVRELARLVGGAQETASSLAHARNMLEEAKK